MTVGGRPRASGDRPRPLVSINPRGQTPRHRPQTPATGDRPRTGAASTPHPPSPAISSSCAGRNTSTALKTIQISLVSRANRQERVRNLTKTVASVVLFSYFELHFPVSSLSADGGLFNPSRTKPLFFFAVFRDHRRTFDLSCRRSSTNFQVDRAKVSTKPSRSLNLSAI